MAAPRTVHLIDALPYVFRAFFSLPESITDPQGRPAHAVRGLGAFRVRSPPEAEPPHAAASTTNR